MKNGPLNLKVEEINQMELNVHRSRSITLRAKDRRYCLLRYLRSPKQEVRYMMLEVKAMQRYARLGAMQLQVLASTLLSTHDCA
jgi:hypothetical protein